MTLPPFMIRRSAAAKIVLALAFLLAVIFGLAQRKQDPYTYGDSRDAGQELRNYYDKGRQLAGQNDSQNSVTFLAVGDIMLSRNVAGTALKAGDPLYPFRNMRHIFQSVDFSFGNLESPFSGTDTFNPSGSLVFNAPRSMVRGLAANKFEVVTLANNHAYDQGETGIHFTLSHLDDNRIRHAGVGKDLTAAWEPAAVERNGITTCFIGASYSSVNDSGATRNDFVARIDDTESLKQAVAQARQRCDYTVVAMHAGTEYTTKPNRSQTDFARAAIDAGADLVIGHHPHWVQTIERYCPGSGQAESDCGDPKYIFYSLGNFIFDQEWSRQTKEGLALKIRLTKRPASGLQGPRLPAKLERIELIPVVIEDYSTPRPATAEESKNILDRIGEDGTSLFP